MNTLIRIFWNTGLVFFLVIPLAAVTVQDAQAQSAGPSPQVQPVAGGWEFSMTPYFWTTFITGEQTAGNTTIDIDTNAFEMIDEAKEFYFFMSETELRKGRLGIQA